jgi:hypothetical protein
MKASPRNAAPAVAFRFVPGAAVPDPRLGGTPPTPGAGRHRIAELEADFGATLAGIRCAAYDRAIDEWRRNRDRF